MLGSSLSYLYASRYGIVKDFLVANDAGIFIFIISSSIFYLFSRNRHIFKENWLVSTISDTSFGIYLIHPLFLAFLNRFLLPIIHNPLIYILLASISTFFASIIVLHHARKIKWVRAIS